MKPGAGERFTPQPEESENGGDDWLAEAADSDDEDYVEPKPVTLDDYYGILEWDEEHIPQEYLEKWKRAKEHHPVPSYSKEEAPARLEEILDKFGDEVVDAVAAKDYGKLRSYISESELTEYLFEYNALSEVLNHEDSNGRLTQLYHILNTTFIAHRES